MSIHDVWTDVMKTEGVREKLMEHGFSEATLNRIDRTLSDHDQVHSIDKKGRLRSKGKSGTEFVIRDLAAARQDRDFASLLSKNKFDTVASRFDRPGRVAMDVVKRDDDSKTPEIDLLDGALAVSTMSMIDLNRQAQELEEAGIPAVEGDFWWLMPLILGGIALALLIAAGVCYFVCIGGDDLESDVCDAVGILLFLALAFLAMACFGYAGGTAGTIAPVLTVLIFGGGVSSFVLGITALGLFGGEGTVST